MSFTIIKKLSLSGRATGQNIIHLRQEQMHQNRSFMLSRHVPISFRSWIARRDTQKATQRLISLAVTNVPKVTMSFTQWVGMPLVCQLSNTLWIRGMTQQNLQQKTLPTSNVKSMRLDSLYDWDREVNTTDPNYYKWTQWIFTKLYEKA